MLNASCNYEEPLYALMLNWISSFLSIPIYGVAFIVLLTKCPRYFDEYQKYLVVHIISGFLLDFHIRVIWKLSVPLPWAAMCSNGFAAEFAVNSFQIFAILLFFTGSTALTLFMKRMEAVHVKDTKIQKVVFFWKNLFYAFFAVVLVLLILIYSDLKHQKEYKAVVEYKLGKMPDYMWCDNCYFMQFDSKIFITFYILGYCTIMCAVITGVLASIKTFIALNSNTLRLSPKTAAIQRNFMFSLIVAITVHLTLIFIPLALHFLASFTPVHIEFLGPTAVLMIQDHGSVSTFTMIITNKLLRKATKKLFLIPENLLRKSEPKMFQSKKKKTSGVNVLTPN